MAIGDCVPIGPAHAFRKPLDAAIHPGHLASNHVVRGGLESSLDFGDRSGWGVRHRQHATWEHVSAAFLEERFE